MSIIQLYECKFCHKKFSSERIFMRHECTEMIRNKEIQTAAGQMAYGMYKIWMEKQRRKPPSIIVFMTSSYYSAFLNTVSWIKETGISDTELFITVMIKEKISPSLWRREEAYKLFLDFIDKKVDPMTQVINSIEFLIQLADDMDVSIESVFKNRQCGDILKYINKRKLSPWFLLCSKSFKEWAESLNVNEVQMLKNNIGISYWSIRLSNEVDSVKEIKSTISLFGL